MIRHSVSRRAMVRGLTAGLACVRLCPGQIATPAGAPERLQIGESNLEVTFDGGQFDLARPDLLEWVNQSAMAVAHYFGRFPVAAARVAVSSRDGRQGVSGGRTWGYGAGNHGVHTRVSIGQHTTVGELKRDWVLTHEFVHYGFPDMPDRNHWIEEGLATYVEPIARVGVGTQSAPIAWFEMIRDMPQGQPKAGDEGLDNTHTWGRTYWGGAIFCLLADIAIRKNTRNAKGLRDALRAIVAAGGNIEVQWPLERALETGDKAVGGTSLMSLYRQMGENASPVDLPALWKELGVERQGDSAVFNDNAPLAAIRQAILR
jgi:hypothetical protein